MIKSIALTVEVTLSNVVVHSSVTFIDTIGVSRVTPTAIEFTYGVFLQSGLGDLVSAIETISPGFNYTTRNFPMYRVIVVTADADTIEQLLTVMHMAGSMSYQNQEFALEFKS